MKQIIAVTIVIALMLTTLPAAASSYSDIDNTPYRDAIATLTKLQLLTGFPDGTFRPSDTLNRAQFAAIAVRSLGLGQLEPYSRGSTKFPDVPATHWASGYINIATDQNTIGGYTDGTFRPNSPVTGAEALAMLIRVLGYDPVVTGSWPTNYLVKAFELNISRGVNFSANEPVTRGNVALFVNNALDVPLMKPEMVGAVQTYRVVEGTSLLRTKLGFEPITGRVTETPYVLNTSLTAKQIEIDNVTYDLTDDIDLTDYLGRMVTAYHADKTIVRISIIPEQMISGIISQATFDNDVLTSITIDNNQYDVSDTVIYRNMVRAHKNHTDYSWLDAEAKLHLNSDGSSAFLNALLYKDSVVITGIDPRFNRVTGIDGSVNRFSVRHEIDYELIIDRNGQYATYDDLQVGDVFHFFITDSGLLYMEVITDQVYGFISQAYIDDSGFIVTVGSDEYRCSQTPSLSPDLTADFLPVTENNLIPYIGTDVILYLDRYAHVRHIVGDVDIDPSDPDTYAIIETPPYTWHGPDGPEEFIRLLMADETIVRYTITGDTDIAGDPLNRGSVVRIVSDGTDLVLVELILTPSMITKTVDDLYPAITAARIDGQTHKLDQAVVFTYDGEITGAVSISDLLTADSGFDVAIYDSEQLFLSAVLLDPTDLDFPVDTVEQIGVITRRYITSDGPMFSILTGKQMLDCFLPASGSTFNKGDLVSFICEQGVLVSIEVPPGLYDGLVADQYEYYVVSYEENTRVLTIASELSPDAPTANLLIDREAVIFDCTSSIGIGEEYLLKFALTVKLVTTDGIVTCIKITN